MMKSDTRFQITGRQFIFILVGASTGSGILSLPRTTSKEAFQDAWIAVLLGVLIPLISLFIIEKLCKKYPGDTLNEISNKLFGAILGRVLTVGFIVYAIFVSAISIRIFVEITNLYILPRTPMPVVLAIYIIFVVYTVKNGTRLVGRFNELVFYILPVSLIFLLPSLSLGSITNLLPVGGAGLINILKASIATTFPYACTELIPIYYPMLKEKKKVIRNGIITLSIIAFMYVFVTIASLLVFGADIMQGITWPPIILYKIVNIPVIERLDLFFLVIWTAIAVRPCINYSFASSYTVTRLVNLKPEKHLTIISVIVGVFIYTIAVIPHNLQQIFDITSYLGYIYLAMGIGYPAIFLAASLFKKTVSKV